MIMILNRAVIVVSVSHADAVTNSYGGTIQSEDGITFNEIKTLDNAGYILTNLDLIINGLDSFINRGEFAQVFGLNILISKVSSVINRDYAWLIADDTLKMSDVDEFKNTLSFEDVKSVVDDAATYVQANNIEMDVGKLTNTGYGSLLVGISNLNINANEIINNEEGTIVTDNMLSINADSLLNDTGYIDGPNYDINVKSLINKGQISSSYTGGVSTITADSINNSEGNIYNAGALTLKTTLLNNSDAGYIWGSSKLELDLDGDLNNADYNTIGSSAGGILSIKTTGDVTIDKTIESKATVSIDAGNITNNAAIVSLNNVYLAAENIINSTNSLIFAMSDIIMSATDTILNKLKGNILSQGAISLSADTIHNYAGVIRSEGSMWLNAKTIHNESTYTGEEWDYGAREEGTYIYKEGDTGGMVLQ